VFGGPTATLSDELAFVDTEHPDSLFLTFAEYFLWSKRFAAGLQKAGLKPQDRVVILSTNSLFYPVAVMGTIMAGGIVTGANPTFTPRELIYQLKDTEARYVLVTPPSIQTAIEAAKAVKMPLSNLFVFDDEHLNGVGKPFGDIKHWSQLIADRETGQAFSWKELSTVEELNETIILVYSSGTTGLPKGVEMSHATVVSDLASKKALHAADPQYAFTNEQAKDYPVLCYLPMYAALGMVLFSIAMAARRQPVYIMKRFELLKFVENIQKFRPFYLLLVPSIAVAMAKHPLIQSRKFDLSSVKRVEAGAAPLSREICEEVERLWPAGDVNIKQVYGMTE
jgi:acyl-CoA synthetase (AMP-forming)/AMP-acid ligase II